jgi:DNA-directed RNA polymerase specialized sigma24 family protein
MQQTAVLKRGLDCPTSADDQLRDADHAALAATAELVGRAHIGEQAAWDQLVERYGAMVWTVARGHGLGLEDAAAVSQVTWLLLAQHLGLLRQPERLGVWLLATATREAFRMCRLRGLEVHVTAEHNFGATSASGSPTEADLPAEQASTRVHGGWVGAAARA